MTVLHTLRRFGRGRGGPDDFATVGPLQRSVSTGRITTELPQRVSDAVSGPAPAGGTGIVAVRITTKATESPNTNCDTINQGQSTVCCNAGLTTPISP